MYHSRQPFENGTNVLLSVSGGRGSRNDSRKRRHGSNTDTSKFIEWYPRPKVVRGGTLSSFTLCCVEGPKAYLKAERVRFVVGSTAQNKSPPNVVHDILKPHLRAKCVQVDVCLSFCSNRRLRDLLDPQYDNLRIHARTQSAR